MAARPVEKRVIGLIMRNVERQGLIEPPTELRELVAEFPYSSDEIDHGFELFVSAEGRTIGGTVVLDELPGQGIGALVIAGLIEKAGGGEWELTEKGRLLSVLLYEYADQKYRWRSQIEGDDRSPLL